MYLPDKRGTGKSSYLGCTPPSLFLTDRPSCFAQLKNDDWTQDRLATTTYTNTAKDMLFLLNATGANGQRRVVVGSSNGGFLAQRMLLVAGPSAKATLDDVILNSAPPANGFNITEGFMTATEVGTQIVADCHADSTCRSHFSAAGVTGATTPMLARDMFIRQGIRGSHRCLNALNTTFREVSWSMASQLEVPGSWQLIPVLLLRLARCNEQDLAALRFFVDQIPSPFADPSLGPGTSLVVEYAIDWSENWFGPLPDNYSVARACDRLDGGDSFSFVSYKTGRWYARLHCCKINTWSNTGSAKAGWRH